MSNRISAALIVKNEAAVLGDCLASLVGIADEVVVVDTGSDDNTVAIAKQHGAKLGEFAWNGRFDDARNHALSLATGDWILYIDADERAHCDDPAALRAQLGDPLAVAALVHFSVRSGFTPFKEMRLFRNRPDIRFRGLIHETMRPDVQALVDAGQGQVIDCNLALEHVGYEGDLTHKHKRNLPLLEQAVQEDPDRAYLWAELGRAFDALGHAEQARQAWQSGIDAVRRGDTQSGRALVFSYWVAARHRRQESAQDLLDEAHRVFPDSLELRWHQAQQHVLDNDHPAAIVQLSDLVEHGPPAVDLTTAYDRRMFGLWAYEQLGASEFALGNFAASARWYEKALGCEPDDVRLQTLYSVARARSEG